MGSKVSKGPLKTPFWSTNRFNILQEFSYKGTDKYNITIRIYIYNPNRFPLCLFYPSDLSISPSKRINLKLENARYHDYLQAPLQPLQDNLESQTCGTPGAVGSNVLSSKSKFFNRV